MWMWWSRGIGGRSAVDYLMRVRDMTFIEAVSQIANDESALRKQYEKPKPRTERNLILPTKAENNDIAIEYLKQRGINENVISTTIDVAIRNCTVSGERYSREHRWHWR